MATKKVKNAMVTPIDQGETFVSLSMNKSLSEADAVAIEEKLRALYELQQIDTKIDKIYLLRGELPLEVQDIEDEVEGLKTRIANAREEIAGREKHIADCNNQIVEAQNLIKKYEAQHDNVKNNREYESIAKEIEFQKLDIKTSEKRIREANETIEEKKALIAETEERLKMRQDDLDAKRRELATIVEETAKDEEELLRQREVHQAKLDERTLIAYNKVRNSTKNKLAVVTVNRDACGGCFNKIPPQRQLDIRSSKKIIVCEYCGRILVSSDFAPKAEQDKQ